MESGAEILLDAMKSYAEKITEYCADVARGMPEIEACKKADLPIRFVRAFEISTVEYYVDMSLMRQIKDKNNRTWPEKLMYDVFNTEQLQVGVNFEELLSKALSTIQDKRAKDVIFMYYKEGMTLDEIGRKMLLSRERVRQIKERSLRQLRHPCRRRFWNESFVKEYELDFSSVTKKLAKVMPQEEVERLKMQFKKFFNGYETDSDEYDFFSDDEDVFYEEDEESWFKH